MYVMRNIKGISVQLLQIVVLHFSDVNAIGSNSAVAGAQTWDRTLGEVDFLFYVLCSGDMNTLRMRGRQVRRTRISRVITAVVSESVSSCAVSVIITVI